MSSRSIHIEFQHSEGRLESKASLVYTADLVSKKESKDSCMVKWLKAGESPVRYGVGWGGQGRALA